MATHNEHTRENDVLIIKMGNNPLVDYFRRHAQVPKPFLDHYAALGISNQEAMFIVHLHYFWWASAMERDPHPSLSTIAMKMGCSWRQAHRYAAALKQKGYLTITNRTLPGRGKVTNEYDLEPLVLAVLNLHLATKSTDLTSVSGGHMTSMSDGHLSSVSDEEETVQRDAEQEDSFMNSNTARGHKDRTNLHKPAAETRRRMKPDSSVASDDADGASAIRSRARSQSPDDSTGETAVGRLPERSHQYSDGPRRGGMSSVSALLTPGSALLRYPHLVVQKSDGAPKPARRRREGTRTAQRSQTRREEHPDGNLKPSSRPPRATAPEPITIAITEISAKLHDEHVRSTLTWAARLWHSTGFSEEAFVGKLYEASSIASQQRNVRRRRADGRVNRVPYWKTVVLDLLGKRAAATRAAAGEGRRA